MIKFPSCFGTTCDYAHINSKRGINSILTLFGCHAILVTEDSCFFLIILLIHLKHKTKSKIVQRVHIQSDRLASITA
jgi:hypothetical protein